MNDTAQLEGLSGASAPEQTACPEKTRTDLDLDRVLGAIADRCASERGKRRAMTLPFLATRAEVEVSLYEIGEARGLASRDRPLPRDAVPDVREALDRSRIRAALSAEEILAISKVLTAAKNLRKFLRAHRDEAANLAVACDTDPELDTLANELARCFEPDGTISDNASPRLAELRSERRASRDRIVRRMQELIARYGDILSDAFYTERDGRYVLPVRSDAHERFPGIVHSASSGGATLFVEPRAIIPMGNRHKVLDSAVEQEEAAVLARLATDIAAHAPEIRAASDALAHADLRGASARLAADLDLHAPTIPEIKTRKDMAITLVSARHPILLLDGVEVVSSDIEVHAGQALVVSGPNAGGKTVALKTLGLSALMLRMGLPVPADPGSSVALFDQVLTDVGDEQSLAKNLSTFSAHIKNLATILDDTHEGTLVLLDEIASGTDPREGEALATALLESLAKRGGAVACTTHYEGLKILALDNPHFRNASVGFDLEAMAPNFRLALDVPGASSALAVARRFGIPGSIVERAEGVLSEEILDVSRVVARLNAERDGFERDRRELRAEIEALAEKQRILDAERERLGTKERGAVVRETEELMSGIKRAREELRAAQARIRHQKLDEKDITEATKAIDRVASTVAIGGPLEQTKPAVKEERAAVRAGELFPGMKVFVPRLRTDAEILEVLPSGQLRVAAGPLKLLTSVDEVRRAAPGKDGKGGGAKPAKAQPKRNVEYDAAADPDIPIQTSDNTVDLRGLRAHEAVAIAEQFLDRCMNANKRVAFLIHGHGTGALRQVLREALRSSPYVERTRPGEPREGGDGVTVVWLK